MKKVISVAIIVLVSVSMLFAADWWQGQEIEQFVYNGLQNVSSSAIDDALYAYRHAVFSDEVFSEIEEALYAIDGIDFFTTQANKNEETGGLEIVFDFYELPMLTSISFEGNEKVKTSDLREALTTISAGSYYDTSRKSVFETAKQEVVDYYASKGFEDVPVEMTLNENTENNTFSVVFSVTEGLQTRIVSISFSGN